MRKLLSLFFLLTIVFCSAQKKVEGPSGYWQQEVKYKINVALDDVNHTLQGFEEITYINNSPHTLNYLYFHLWPNAYKNQTTALAKQLLENGETDYYFDNNKYNGYIDSLNFMMDGDTLEWEFKGDSIDICKIKLKCPVSPNDSIIISTPFFVKIPSGNYSRLGHIGQSYQITQWFPKPAVYDKNGWNEMPYLTQGEFYSEYGSFDVKITLPANYYVGHTGYLVNDFKEIDVLKKRAEETEKMLGSHINKVGNIIDPNNNGFPASSKELKTLHIKQQRVHDFAFFADKRYYILRGEVELPYSKKKVKTMAMFTAGNSRYWAKSIEYLNNSIYYYSLWNGDYPYSQCTAVDGTISAGGGMEYPNVTVIGDVNSDESLETVIMHEVGHNWFYGILGSNEREHPWMDEGINSFNEMRYNRTLHPERSLIGGIANVSNNLMKKFGVDHLKSMHQYYLAYLLSARKNNDQPIEAPAADYTGMNYGTIVYSKTAVAFDYLHDFLGAEVFDKAMRVYFDTWKFKHPSPQDLQMVFEYVSKQDLNWFFKDLIETNKVVDYKFVRKLKVNTKSTVTFGWLKYEETLVVKNVGDISAPFSISGIFKDTDSVLYEKWYPGFKKTMQLQFPNCECDRFVIDYGQHSTEFRRSNNTLHERKLFKKLEKPRFQFIGSIENPERTLINWVPVFGANAYDGFMAGMAFYNSVFPAKNFEYTLMPMYSIRNNKARGYGSMSYRFHGRQSSFIHSIKPGVQFSTFGKSTLSSSQDYNAYSDFIKIAPSLEIKFKKKTARSENQHSITYRYLFIEEKSASFCESCDSVTNLFLNDNQFHELNYHFVNSNTIHPWNVKYTARYHKEFLLNMLEANYKHLYNEKGSSIYIRFFVGGFFSNNSSNSRYNLRMDGQRGFHDYTYDEVYPARFETEGIWSQQFTESYGAFKVPTAYGQSNKWIAALNLKADLPIPIIFPFIDLGVGAQSGSVQFLYDAGIGINIGKGWCSVYFPFLFSKEIQTEIEANNRKFNDQIRFTFNLSKINPLKLVRDI